ncbi:hypothetical protein EV715DRAFT_290363 [Schizophyllum commune]
MARPATKSAPSAKKDKPPRSPPTSGQGGHKATSTASRGRDAEKATSGGRKKAGGQRKTPVHADISDSDSDSESEATKPTSREKAANGANRKALNKRQVPVQVGARNVDNGGPEEDEGALNDAAAGHALAIESDDSIEEASSEDDLSSLREKLAKANARARKLKQQTSSASTGSEGSGLIGRPKGIRNIQIGMGLAGGPGSKKNDLYESILREVRDLVIQANLPWHLPWDDIPYEDRAKLCRAAREKAPFLRRFKNDWPAIAMAQQYCKNRRNDAYRKGLLEPPAKYAYLKDNAAKRSETGMRGKRVYAEAEATTEEPAKTKRRRQSTRESESEGRAAPEASTSKSRAGKKKKRSEATSSNAYSAGEEE